MTRLAVVVLAIVLLVALLISVVSALASPDPTFQLGSAPRYESTSDTWPREFVPFVTTTTEPKRPPSTKRFHAAGAHPWDALMECEDNDDPSKGPTGWQTHTGNGFEGGLQFTNGTWLAHGGGEFAQHAYDATREQQIVVAERVLAAQGWGAWPTCSRLLGLR